jgi:glutamate dehydrogenase (NADP+)
LGILKFLAFEQTFKNALTTLPMGGAQGGSDFEPKGKSDDEVMRFCQSYMSELSHHIGQDTDIPDGGLGVGAREIGYLFGMYKKQRNEFAGVLTGKGLQWGGSYVRPQATGYGIVYFAAEMLAANNDSLEGKTCLVSGSGNVAQHTAEKIIELGGKVVTLSDSSGFIYDPEGIDQKKLDFVKRLKNMKRGRIREYIDKYSETVYTEADSSLEYNPLWNQRADCAFPCAVENEIGENDAFNLINNGVKLVCEGADMPSSPEALKIFMDKKLLFAPAKAANAGGVAVSGLEMAQNRMLLNWSAEEVDRRLKTIMKNIHQNCLDVAERYGVPGNYLVGANIAGFVRVADATLDQGLV